MKPTPVAPGLRMRAALEECPPEEPGLFLLQEFSPRQECFPIIRGEENSYKSTRKAVSINYLVLPVAGEVDLTGIRSADTVVSQPLHPLVFTHGPTLALAWGT